MACRRGCPERDLKWLLHPEDHVSRDPTVRHFSWNITKATRAPNGVRKDIFLINDQFPGPTIEARSGDTLEIEVFNSAEEEVSLHWHGLHMRGANHMDGPVGITQCAIKQGRSFTYRVPIGDQVGTFWYHAHSEVQRADGLYGGLVVHNPVSPLDNSTYQYDHELLFLVGDWYHRQADQVLGMFLRMTSGGIEPVPDSLLINGLGRFECSKATHGSPVNCSDIAKPRLSLDKQLRYRVRLINVGSLTGLSFTIPDSELIVIGVDGGLPVAANTDNTNLINSVGVLYPAERVDFIISWPESNINSDTELIISLDKENFLRPNPALTRTQPFLLSAESSSRQPVDTNHTSEIVPLDLRTAKGHTLPSPLPEAENFFMIWASITILNRLAQVPHGMVNRTFWEPQELPLISTTRDSWDEHQLVPWTGAKPVWVELTINNLDSNGHPFHLHGFDFYIIASYEGKGGWDYYNPWDTSRPPRGGPFNLENPLRKDTVYVPPWGYVVIRFLADNPGIWALHCHILWHQGSGMAMAFQVMGDEQSGFSSADGGMGAERFCKA
ncbi:iron transport multicopper oxidase fet3 [Xylogone sp. PMI_703]|nr:iron transport multicopper oxidase fet3 [Xylogone sp. PMI_703]